MHTKKYTVNVKCIDLALTVREFAPPSLPSRTLFKDRYVGVIRADHPLAGKDISLDQFCASSHLLVSPFRGDASGPTDHTLATINRKRMIGLVVPGFSVVGSLLEHTDLMAVLPERLLSVMHRELWTFETPISIPGFEVEAIWPERLNADPAQIWIRDLIVTASKEHDTNRLNSQNCTVISSRDTTLQSTAIDDNCSPSGKVT